ncbi:uncharacterized protein LOC106055324 [Biomphalaria glabrata]|uniref:Uncharacterized protein LOC106055324 n=1 Tax=Biomphalaria glabrata TaxID=6526 RepID=A0A9W2ZBI7_BIOGL|nr:uncharacterized protein LOC106055324 [Biomphalaria glabrata]
MNKLIIGAAIFAIVLGLAYCQSTVYSTDTSEGHIKQLIYEAKQRCSHCQDTADKVLSRTLKSDICSAVSTYALCTIACIDNPVSNQVSDAKKICNGSPVLQVSIFVLIFSAAAKYLF